MIRSVKDKKIGNRVGRAKPLDGNADLMLRKGKGGERTGQGGLQAATET